MPGASCFLFRIAQTAGAGTAIFRLVTLLRILRGTAVFWLLAGTGMLAQPPAVGLPAEHAMTDAADQTAQRADQMAALQAEAARLQAAVQHVSPSKKNALARSVHKGLGCAGCHGEAEMGDEMGERTSGSRAIGIRRPDPVITCAKCHAPAMAAFQPSAHATGSGQAGPNAATCVACHGSHSVTAVRDPESPVSTLRVSETCARCHDSVSVTARQWRQPDVVADYRQSFHGLAIGLGDRRAATCVSCHGRHEIRPSRDPLSSVSAAKLHDTCASCHTGTTPGFAAGGVHHNPVRSGHKVVDIVRYLYLMVIVVVIGSMLLHNGLDFRGRLRERRLQRSATPGGPTPGATHLRFSITERVQHWTLAASFGLLAVTGFALVYGWRIPLVEPQQGAVLRGVLHRAAAVVFITLSVFHVGYVLLTRRGRENLHATFPHAHSSHDWFCRFAACFRLGPPSGADWRDLVQTVKYNLGVVATRPAMGRFTYAEKMEYVAMLWGSVVMIATGLILWIKMPFLDRFQYWVFDLVTTVHFYEAMLATLSVFAWHFYYTIYNPHVFPLAKTMVTGRISHEDMEHDHALELRPPEAPATHATRDASDPASS
jgi:cytochrome b subunit of formate dehydrogenase